MSEWQRIDTAPEDGDSVLLAWWSSQMVRSGHWDDNGMAWVTENGMYSGSASPTHWMPLPEPPA